MVFSSLTFLYVFLPVVMLTYYLVPKKFRNLVILFSGMFFYAWGEPIFIIVMLMSNAVDYTAGQVMHKYDSNDKIRFFAVLTSVILNLLFLSTFKYSSFIIENINAIFGSNIPDPHLPLPIGISFSTFQSLSYTIDLYRRKIKVQNSFINFTAYVSLFPQIVAGPIVRYEDVENEIDDRELTLSMVGDGVGIFIKGLAKKVLLANNIGLLWTSVKAMDYSNISVFTAWLGIMAFAMQIYFDFSGYSDMAVGLGKMLGFEFPQNFDHPYTAKSVTDFWRRWHMTMTGWFRSYVYFPLGGNRGGALKTLRNILIVWALTGLWHGASWNFIIWGLYFAVLLILEKFVYGKYLDKLPSFIKIIYTFVLVLFGWVLFDTSSLSDAVQYFKAMFGGSGVMFDSDSLYQFRSYIIIFAVCMFASTYAVRKIVLRAEKHSISRKVYWCAEPLIQLSVMVVCTAYLVNETYNPFLYFRF